MIDLQGFKWDSLSTNGTIFYIGLIMTFVVAVCVTIAKG